jgi:hypothetical protein
MSDRIIIIAACGAIIFMRRGIRHCIMAKTVLTAELSVYIRAEKTDEVPLEVYDTLYYSGRFDPIYRIQGDMVLSAFYRPEGYRESRIRRMGRNMLKGLTVDIKDKPGGTEIRIENMMPTFEEERSFYRDPKIRLSTKSEMPVSRFRGALDEQIGVLEFAEKVLLKIEGLKSSEDARLLLSLHDNEFATAEVKKAAADVAGKGLRVAVTKHTFTLDYRRPSFNQTALPFIMHVLERNIVS